MKSELPQDARLAAELIERLGRLIRAESHSGTLDPAQWSALRYLASANRVSNTAGALARYLQSTKGTVSQTLNALERKGLIARGPDAASGRIVRLTLTRAGRAAAARDPLLKLAAAIGGLPAPQQHAMAGNLTALLESLQRGNGDRPFGICGTCRHFRDVQPEGKPHWCALLNQPLSNADSALICAEHESKAA